MTARKFEDFEARRSEVQLVIGIVGPSGGGKTYSALRLASGIQKVNGGDIFVIDTEAGRALHYADKFKFRHVPFAAPFGSLDYLAAIEHCVRRGAKTIVIDSMSHEHEGPGGVLDTHDAEVRRMAGDDYRKAEKLKMLAWQKPKRERTRLINGLLQLPVSLICCFRAKEKLKIVAGKEPERMGWMPIAGDEFIFEMTTCVLLPPGADGVPEWLPEEKGSRMIVKRPEPFRKLLERREPLSEAIGEAMAVWAKGDGAIASPPPASTSKPTAAPAAPDTPAYITNAQRAALAGVVQKVWNVEAFVAWLREEHGVASTKEIPAAEFASIMEFVEIRGFEQALVSDADPGPPPDDDDDLSMFDEPGANG